MDKIKVFEPGGGKKTIGISGYGGNRGQATLFTTLVIMFMLMYTAIFLSDFGYKKIKVADYTYSSSRAFYAAEWGVENFMYEKNKGAFKVGGANAYNVGDTVVCGCIANNGNLVVNVAGGTPVSCLIGANPTNCNRNDINFAVEKVSNTEVKSTGAYLETERAIRVQW